MKLLSLRNILLVLLSQIIFSASIQGQSLFSNVIDSTNTNDSSASFASAWGDFDNDGDLDLYVGTFNGPDRLFKNNGDETFTDVTADFNLGTGNTATLAVSWGDYDNDGDLDLFISGEKRINSFYRNDVTTFSNIGNDLGITYFGSSYTVNWVDYDNDGDLDLFNAHWDYQHRLYQNNQNIFTDIAQTVGITETGKCRAGAWGDYDNDGDLDLYICRGASYESQQDLFYRNDNGIFTNIASSVGFINVFLSVSADWGDFDNDGDLDLYVATDEAQPNQLYRNDNGSFIDISAEKGVDNQETCLSVSWVDPDNDGDLDIFVTRVVGFPNLLYENDNGNFTEAQVNFGLGDDTGDSRGHSWGDYNSDGFLDLYVTNRYGDNYLYKNNGNSNNWITIDLNSSISNSNGIGAKIEVVCGDLTQVRGVYNGYGQVSQNSITTEFGLGQNTTIDLITVSWPSGRIQKLTNVAGNQHLNISETGSSNENILIFIDHVKSFVNDTVNVPINVIFPSNALFSSLEFSFDGFQQKLEFISVDEGTGLIGSGGWLTEVNNTDSLLAVVAAGSNDITGSGMLFTLKFFVPDSITPGFIPINIKSALFNNNEIAVEFDSGGVEIIEQMFGDVDLNNIVRAFDASLILKYLVGKYDLNRPEMLNADVSLDSSVSSFDATLILKYVAGLIDSLPHLDPDSSFTLGYGEIAMDSVIINSLSIVEIPIYLIRNENIYSFQGEMTFNSNYLILNSISWSSELEDFIFETNVSTDLLKFSGAGSQPVNSSGMFATMRFIVNNNLADDSTEVKLSSIRWNEGDVLTDITSAKVYGPISISDVYKRTGNIPFDFALFQNYPNPFNPITTIKYSIAERTNVILTVHNSAGQLIDVIVDRVMSPGVYFVQWDATSVSSGIYFYRIHTKTTNFIKKMLYLR